jgi:hypothetical protein
MKKQLLIICGFFFIGCGAIFGSSATTIDIPGSALSDEVFLAGARTLPTLRLTREELLSALDKGIIKGSRKWSITPTSSRYPLVAPQRLRRALVSALENIDVDTGGVIEVSEAFEIDAHGVLRRLVEIYKTGKSDELSLYTCYTRTVLTDAELANPSLRPLLCHYQLLLTFEELVTAQRSVAPAEKAAADQELVKGLTVRIRTRIGVDNANSKQIISNSIRDFLSTRKEKIDKPTLWQWIAFFSGVTGER